MLTDIRFAVRSLRKSPSFTAVALITLALGIGSNAIVFSILDAVLLRPLPVEQPDRLFFVEARHGNGSPFPSHSFPDYLDFKNGTTSIDLAAYRIAAMGLQSGSGAERAWGYLVTGNYFEMLGVRPAVGRFFTPEEDTARGASPFVVLSFDAWRASRLVVDTGMHALGWTRQQAIDFMTEHTALGENNIANEVDRYVTYAGQALAYKIGQLELLRLRAEARERQGNRFDIKRFHDVVLAQGALPLPVLRQVVERELT